MRTSFYRCNRAETDTLEDDRTGINENTIGAVLNGIRLAYEKPSELKEKFGRVQITSC